MFTYALTASFLFCVNASLFPKTERHRFTQGHSINVEVNSLSSFERGLPYEHYSLPFCQPDGGVAKFNPSFNPGDILSGLQLYNSPYQFVTNEHQLATHVCTGAPLTKQQTQDIKTKIDDGYRTQFVIDGMPITTYDIERAKTWLRPGFHLGTTYGHQAHVIFNHLAFNVIISRVGGHSHHAHQIAEDTQWEVLGLEVLPCSIRRTPGELVTHIPCKPWGNLRNPEPQVVEEGEEIVYTYDVYWQEGSTKWERRWGLYMQPPRSSHWVSLCNAVIMLMACCMSLGIIFSRVTDRDLIPASASPLPEKEMERRRWKLIASDVFRAPIAARALAVYVGSGTHLLAAASTTLLAAAAGAFSAGGGPTLATAAMCLYFGLAAVGGAAAVALLRSTQRAATGWPLVCLKTACYFPGAAFGAFCAINALITTTTASTMAAPPSLYLFIAALWLAIGVPLTFLGGALALCIRMPPWPMDTSAEPAEVPPPTRAAYQKSVLGYVISALVPAYLIGMELWYVMEAAWRGYFYNLYGVFATASALTLLIVMAISVANTYTQLCAEDHRWWWRSFHRGGGPPAAVLLAFALVFRLAFLPHMATVQLLLYAVYMTAAAAAVYLCLGAVGFAASLAFVCLVYSRLAVAGPGGLLDASELAEQLLQAEEGDKAEDDRDKAEGVVVDSA